MKIDYRAIGADHLARWGSIEQERLTKGHGYPKRSPFLNNASRSNFWRGDDVPVAGDDTSAAVEEWLRGRPTHERAALIGYYVFGQGPTQVGRELGGLTWQHERVTAGGHQRSDQFRRQRWRIFSAGTTSIHPWMYPPAKRPQPRCSMFRCRRCSEQFRRRRWRILAVGGQMEMRKRAQLRKAARPKCIN